MVIALVLTPDGLPLAYEVMPGNTSDRATPDGFLKNMEQMYGRWVMDRGTPTESTLGQMQERGIDYLVGTPKGQLSAVEQKLLGQPWTPVHEAIR